LVAIACVLDALLAASKLVLGLIIPLLVLATLIKTGWLPGRCIESVRLSNDHANRDNAGMAWIVSPTRWRFSLRGLLIAVAVMGSAFGIVVSSLQAYRRAALRSMERSQLKQVALALRNYEENDKTLPAAIIQIRRQPGNASIHERAERALKELALDENPLRIARRAGDVIDRQIAGLVPLDVGRFVRE
jgi:hypothetical protein